eukprot:scaffold79741_cov50-Phaeocystis_antarctica.AAC.7
MPKGETRLIKQTGVFMTTATFSLVAYIWVRLGLGLGLGLGLELGLGLGLEFSLVAYIWVRPLTLTLTEIEAAMPPP